MLTWTQAIHRNDVASLHQHLSNTSSLGRDINQLNVSGFTALSISAESGHVKCLRLLLEHKADPNRPSSNFGQRTALSFACSKPLLLRDSQLQVMEALLDAGADIDFKDVDGWTPIMFATRHMNEEAIALLLKRGADLTIKSARTWQDVKAGCRFEAGSTVVDIASSTKLIEPYRYRFESTDRIVSLLVNASPILVWSPPKHRHYLSSAMFPACVQSLLILHRRPHDPTPSKSMLLPKLPKPLVLCILAFAAPRIRILVGKGK